MTASRHDLCPWSIWGAGCCGGNRAEVVRVVHGTGPVRGLLCGTTRYRMKCVGGYPSPEGCASCGALISIDVGNQEEGIGIAAWVTYSCGGSRLCPVAEGRDGREENEI